MKKVLIFLSLILCIPLFGQTVNGGDADVIMAGIGGSDKYVSAGTEITFNREISGFVVVGSTDIIVSSIKYGRRGQDGTAVSAGVFNYLDEGLTLKAGEYYIFPEYVIKMTFTSGGEIIVNYKK